MKRARKPFLFTVVELLVVVAIIVILVALLFPSLKRGREYARQSVCASNQRQIFQCLAAYSMDYNVWPSHREGGSYWFAALFPYAYGSKVYNTPNLLSSIFHCPSKANGLSWNPGYGMNDHMLVRFMHFSHSDYDVLWSPNTRLVPSRVSSPEIWPAAMDADNWWSCSSNKSNSHMSFRHLNPPYGNVAAVFCDGHVESSSYASYKKTPW